MPCAKNEPFLIAPTSYGEDEKKTEEKMPQRFRPAGVFLYAGILVFFKASAEWIKEGAETYQKPKRGG